MPEKALLKSRNIGQVDLIWPRIGVVKKSGVREMVFKRGMCDLTAEPWTKRVVFREEEHSAAATGLGREALAQDGGDLVQYTPITRTRSSVGQSR